MHSPNEDQYLTSAQVRARYGGCSQMWLHRKLQNPNSGFPQPVKLGGGRLRYWRLSELVAWEKASALGAGAQAA